MTDKTCDRWTKTGNGNNPVSFKHVLVAVDGVVMVGFWNETPQSVVLGRSSGISAILADDAEIAEGAEMMHEIAIDQCELRTSNRYP